MGTLPAAAAAPACNQRHSAFRMPFMSARPRDCNAHTAATAGPGGEGNGSEGEEVPSLGWLRFIKSFGRG